MRLALILATTAALAACSPPPKEAATAPAAPAAPAPVPAKPVAADIPAGSYVLDKAHGSLTFKVSHLGFSNYTARFGRFDVKLQLDPKNPAAATVEADIDPKSLELNTPPKGFLDEILGQQFLDAKQFPKMGFRSTKVEPTGPDTARITGDMTLHGVTRPVTLEAKYNGGWAGNQYDPNARIGFSAHGTLNRGDFGVSSGIPAPGSSMGVSNAVEVMIEAEFTGPAWVKPKA